MRTFYLLRYNILIVALFFVQVVFAQAPTAIQQLCPNGTVILNTDNDSGTIYQWQVNTGSGFTDLMDDANYSGSDIPSIQLINLPSAWYGYQYRCVVDGLPDNVFKLQFVTDFIGLVDNWSDTRNWSCGKLPDANTDVIIAAAGDGVIVDINAICRSLTLNPNASLRVDPGVTLSIVH